MHNLKPFAEIILFTFEIVSECPKNQAEGHLECCSCQTHFAIKTYNLELTELQKTSLPLNQMSHEYRFFWAEQLK
jgi:hypothetical protein